MNEHLFRIVDRESDLSLVQKIELLKDMNRWLTTSGDEELVIRRVNRARRALGLPERVVDHSFADFEAQGTVFRLE
ncbi:MAG: hypothetical protein AAGF12_04090 [Myxococcota bacterium]